MTFLAADISTFQLLNLLFVVVLLFLGYKYLESTWSYKISKPYLWETAVKNKQIPKELLKIERTYRDKSRFYHIWFQIEHLKRNHVKGAFAELGVYQGHTAKMMHHSDPDRTLYLFDTFAGFDAADLKQESQKDGRFSVATFADTSLDQVKQHINGNDNVKYRTGLFPETAAGLENEQFAFVNIDADLYAPTLAALQFFYPRLSPGGILIVHDYNHSWDGIPKAINEFMPTISESLVELADWQGSAMIIKNS